MCSCQKLYLSFLFYFENIVFAQQVYLEVHNLVAYRQIGFRFSAGSVSSRDCIWNIAWMACFGWQQ
jgi:hypothetical protein